MNNTAWEDLYPGWDPTTLETTGVFASPNYACVYVRDDHPIMRILRHNKNVLNVSIDDVPKIDGQWYKVTRQLMERSCELLRTYFIARHPERLCMPPPHGPLG